MSFFSIFLLKMNATIHIRCRSREINLPRVPELGKVGIGVERVAGLVGEGGSVIGDRLLILPKHRH